MDALKKFEDLLEKALAKFGQQESDVADLKIAVEQVQKTMTSLKAQRDIALANNTQFDDKVGFRDEDTAKGFMTFVKAAWNNDASVKDLTEGTDTEGGFTVPEEFRATLIRLIEVFGLARRFATVLPMSRFELKIPKLTTGVTVFWIGENAPITASEPVFGELLMIAKKLATLIPITNELLEDTALPMANLLATLIAEAMAAEEDRVAWAGDVAGAGDPFNGVLFEAGTVTVTMAVGNTAFTDVDGDDLSDMISAIIASAQSGAWFIMHRTIFNIVRKLKDTTGEYIYASIGSPQQPGTIWGFPYAVSDLMPDITLSAADTAFIFFGNLRHIYIGDRKRMTIAQSMHAGFANDKTFLRAIQRESIAVAIPEAFSVLKTSAT